jgi:chaperonin cofactor prefoldin
LQELFEQSQIVGKWHDAIKAVQRKHNRHADELQALEEVLKNLRSVGVVFIFSSRDDSFIILPLTMAS